MEDDQSIDTYDGPSKVESTDVSSLFIAELDTIRELIVNG